MIFPSIDLMNGKAVQLRQGREKIVERNNPLDLAERFSVFGDVAVIDLDAAMGRGDNEALIAELCRTADCRVGGGIRSIEKAVRILNYGATKIIISTKVLDGKKPNYHFLDKLKNIIGRDRIIIALDYNKDEIVVDAWRKPTGLDPIKIAEQLVPYTSEFLFTAVHREGMMKGVDMNKINNIKEAIDLPVTVAGGITSTSEIEFMTDLGMSAQIGMALYTKKISIEKAFISSVNWGRSLVPTVVTDGSSQVLTLAYSSRESLRQTLATGRAWYYSRSRKKLWLKGETSGNFQEFKKVRADCDGDALLFTVEPAGPACHTGSYTCFGDETFSLQALMKIVKNRLNNPTPNSYTAQLSDKQVRRKLLEEAGELIEAAGRENIVWEAADLLYFITVLLAKCGVSIEEILSELGRRRRKINTVDTGGA